jgi:hypothetical protein
LLPTGSEADPGMRGRPNAQPRGRSAIGWTLTGAVVSQIALALALEGPWAPVRCPEYSHKLKLLHQQTAADPGLPLLLTLGSSRTLNGLRPEYFPPGGPCVFNFGLLAHGPVRQALIFDRLRRDGVRPRWLTIEVAPMFIPAAGNELDAVADARLSWDDVRFLQTQRFRPPARMVRLLGDRATPSYRSRFALLNWLAPWWLPDAARHDFVVEFSAADGWAALPQTPPPAAARDRLRRDAATTLAAFRIAPEADRAMRVILEGCRAEGIKPAVVLMPEQMNLRTLLPADGERRLQEFIACLGDEFAAPVIDARDWCPDDDFWDDHHLLPAGAARFSERFGREVISRLGIGG